MTIHDDDRPDGDGVNETVTDQQPGGRRKKYIAGAVGLAAVLGAGAYMVTAQVMDRNDSAVTQDAGALAPTGGADSVTSSAPAPSVSAAPATSAAKPATGPSISSNIEEEIKAARKAAAADGHPLARALTPKPGLAAATDVQERTEKRGNGSIRIVTARSDLSGQRELLWAADRGTRHGDDTCTQNFHFANNRKPSIRPTMLLCWRTSATRSVATVLIDYDEHPSIAESQKVIAQEWAKLG